MRRFKLMSLLAVVLVLIFLTVEAVPVYASLQGLEQKKEEIDRRIKREQGNLKQYRSREAELSDELDRLDRRLEQLQTELTRVNREIGATEEEINRAEETLAATEAELAGKEELFKRRLRAIYEQSAVPYVDVLLGASTFSDFLTRFNNLKIIAANDQRLIEEVTAERDRIQQMKEKLEGEKNRLDGMRRQILGSEAELERTVTSRKAVMGELQQEIVRNIEEIKKLEQDSERLENEIRSLINPGGSGISGKLGYPVEPPTRISSGYGWRSDPFTGISSWHGGIDIGTYGMANYILAAENGQVSLARWYSDYGNCIIIDHGGGTATLYGHLSSIQVSVGQAVSRGQRIGRAGTTGRSTGVHLHFEVREYNRAPVRYYPNGTPDYRNNPMNYFN
ncbi:MAG: peptidoglycan DD-metalloendopeptidase family protein [Firmicutes bacterium]|jgi:murein DD-endopeptidase MepM/ murein hydrolase activator NlpD|nr:peptidoglycan DD-metalloendopeptidase family protein [Bacillota bacterium]